MATCIAIKNFLESRQHDSIGQFGIDWIERKLDDFEEQEAEESRTGKILLDDETTGGAVHYEAVNILDVMRDDAPCRPFFTELKQLTAGTRP